MLYKKLFALGITLILLGAIIIGFWVYNPQRIFQNKFRFDLPKSAKIINHKYFLFDDEIYFKISFDISDYDEIEKNIINYFKDYGLLKLDATSPIPAFETTCSWWDMDKDQIVFAYNAFMSGKRAKTREVYVFITQDINGQYFLYINH